MENEDENEGVQMIVIRKVSVREGTKQGDTHEFVREVGSGGVVETVVGARVMEEGMLVHVTGGTSGFCSTPSFIFVAPLSHVNSTHPCPPLSSPSKTKTSLIIPPYSNRHPSHTTLHFQHLQLHHIIEEIIALGTHSGTW